jgi:hypothetical protein
MFDRSRKVLAAVAVPVEGRRTPRTDRAIRSDPCRSTSRVPPLLACADSRITVLDITEERSRPSSIYK